MSDKQQVNYKPPSKIVNLKPLVRRKEYMSKANHDGLFMFTGSMCIWQVPRNNTFNGYVNIFESKAQRAYLEKELGIDLNPDKLDNPFYIKHEVKIKKHVEDLKHMKLTFDLSKPTDLLNYLVLKVQHNVAPSWDNRDDTPEYVFVLAEEGDETNDTYSKAELVASLYAHLSTIKDSNIKMYRMLVLYGERVDRSQTKDMLYLKLFGLIKTEDAKILDKLKDIINDKDADLKVLIYEAVKYRVLIKKGSTYSHSDGSVLATGFEKLKEWWEDPNNVVLVNDITDKVKLNLSDKK